MKPNMFIDQRGNYWQAKTIKELCKKLGYSKARRMYVDGKDGNVYHVGWVIGPHWCNAYSSMRVKQ